MARMADLNLAPLVFIASAEPVLGDRAVASVRRQLRQIDPNTDIVELDASTYRSGELHVLLTPRSSASRVPSSFLTWNSSMPSFKRRSWSTSRPRKRARLWFFATTAASGARKSLTP